MPRSRRSSGFYLIRILFDYQSELSGSRRLQNIELSSESTGVFYGGGGKLLGYQALAVVIAIIISSGFTASIMLALQFTIGLRPTEEEA